MSDEESKKYYTQILAAFFIVHLYNTIFIFYIYANYEFMFNTNVSMSIYFDSNYVRNVRRRDKLFT